jgi:hypothetical protein
MAAELPASSFISVAKPALCGGVGKQRQSPSFLVFGRGPKMPGSPSYGALGGGPKMPRSPS